MSHEKLLNNHIFQAVQKDTLYITYSGKLCYVTYSSESQVPISSSKMVWDETMKRIRPSPKPQAAQPDHHPTKRLKLQEGEVKLRSDEVMTSHVEVPETQNEVPMTSNTLKRKPNQLSELFQTWRSFMTRDSFTDLKVICKNDHFAAGLSLHKAILAICSPFLAKILSDGR